MFIDESGEVNINNPDPRFNIFVLCGVMFREDHYKTFNQRFIELKIKYFGNEQVIFHSIKMRNKNNAFKIFQNPELLEQFYIDIGKIFTESEYCVISCVVDKDTYKLKYPEKNHAYEDSLKFLCERGIYRLGRSNEHSLHICLEKRQNRKDSYLKKYYTNFLKYGTNYVSTNEFRICESKLHFRGKNENVNGLQFADLCAYPIARKKLSPDTAQPTFDLFENKFYCNMWGEYKGFGLKTFP